MSVVIKRQEGLIDIVIPRQGGVGRPDKAFRYMLLVSNTDGSGQERLRSELVIDQVEARPEK